MKRLSFFLVFSLAASALFGQMDPVSWLWKAEKIGENEYVLTFTADIKNNWVIYSQYLESDEGPIPTAFFFEDNGAYALIGKVEESGHIKEEHDPVFDMILKKISGESYFKQRIKTIGAVEIIKGTLTYMTCDNERCLPPRDVEFAVKLP